MKALNIPFIIFLVYLADQLSSEAEAQLLGFDMPILVIPKGKYVSWDDFSANAPDNEILDFVRMVGKVARDRGMEQQGYRLLANVGQRAGQEVPHLHVHLFAGEPLGPMLCK